MATTLSCAWDKCIRTRSERVTLIAELTCSRRCLEHFVAKLIDQFAQADAAAVGQRFSHLAISQLLAQPLVSGVHRGVIAAADGLCNLRIAVRGELTCEIRHDGPRLHDAAVSAR